MKLRNRVIPIRRLTRPIPLLSGAQHNVEPEYPRAQSLYADRDTVVEPVSVAGHQRSALRFARILAHRATHSLQMKTPGPATMRTVPRVFAQNEQRTRLSAEEAA
jgi:hypothetical protein